MCAITITRALVFTWGITFVKNTVDFLHESTLVEDTCSD